MKVTVVTSSLRSNYSGGSVHVNNVVRRLTKYFKVEFIPSINFFISNQSVAEEIERIKALGIEVPEFVYSLSTFSNLKPSFLPYSPSVYREYIKNINIEADIIYDPDYTTPESIFISNKSRTPLGLTLHVPLYSFTQSIVYTYYTLRPFFVYSLDYFIKRSGGLYLLTRSKLKYMRQSKYLKFVAGVSNGTLDSVKLNVKKYLIYPGNGVDKELLGYRTKKKEDYVIFWNTLIPPKGILNFLYVLYLLKKRGLQVKAKVSGKFLYDKFRELFFRFAREKELDVEYLGFLSKEELYSTVAKAKLLIYPSLADGFSITVLESLALGTPVIAYSIPTVYSVYKSVPAVKFVKEGDIKGMAMEVEEELRKGKLQEAVYNDEVISFIEFHNWDNVTESIAKILKEEIELGGGEGH
ncbi:glycosyltransferase [Saccharolobus islandicus]|uniref:Glycosyl transferase group 1 n=1 Tax=Saccharolobus islandicus (strain M.16.4 / Kamchatka \|nr:glycosyltransferase [Sulfolobus islandicus]ACR41601.1 glycosyl transferase group 1 [Sulfolobus islandicus M.16.4]